MSKRPLANARMPECKCLNCKREMDAVTSTDPGEPLPKSGDITICLRCGYVMAFRDDMTFRALTLVELQEVSTDPRVQCVQAIRRHVVENGGKA